ncbi:hypothetical protein BX600DRAFT_523949 [Xylariales sp. PMI_506]|nr:hypothetical protein BX600DRAFT_523949 [Xylariales sp. PMI_506]
MAVSPSPDDIPLEDCDTELQTTSSKSTTLPSCARLLLPNPSPHRDGDDIPTIRLSRQGSRFIPLDSPPRLKNNLLGSVGFLELGNAGDFAANIWNQSPLPVYAIVFMVIGGLAAFVSSFFAFRDAKLCWANVQCLRQERQALLEGREKLKNPNGQEPNPTKEDLDTLCHVNFQDLGGETLRFVMDCTMGVAAVLIAIGTFLAIDSADHAAWLASNLMTGYVGNAPCALYNLANAAWCLRLWRLASRHRGLAAQAIPGTLALRQLRRHARHVQAYAAACTIMSLAGGAGSLMTATQWYGYILLLPVILSAPLCNLWWRRRIGYSRPLNGPRALVGLGKDELAARVESAVLAQRVISEKTNQDTVLSRLCQPPPPPHGGGGPSVVAGVLGFLAANDLLGDFYAELLGDLRLSQLLLGEGALEKTYVTVRAADLSLAADAEHARRDLLIAARRFVCERALEHFQHRERCMLELLGAYLDKTAGRRIQPPKR